MAKVMADKLASEIVAASKGEGSAFKKKEDTYIVWLKQTKHLLTLSSNIHFINKRCS
jgi:hypothetical protein